MALFTAVGAGVGGGVMAMFNVAGFDARLLLRLSATLYLNEPTAMLPGLGIKVRSPALSWAAVMTWPFAIAVPLRAIVQSLGSEVMVTLSLHDALPISEKPKSATLKV